MQFLLFFLEYSITRKQKLQEYPTTFEMISHYKQRKNKIYIKTTLHEWFDFYKNNQPSQENIYHDTYFTNKTGKETDPLRLSLENDSYVIDCYFYSIKYPGNGAAIYLSGNVRFLVEFSTFVECSTTGSNSRGGGLYIQFADFAMNHVCAIECKSSSYCSFAFVPSTTSRTVNSIHHSSISYCFAGGHYTMLLAYGYIDIQLVNLSHNTASSYSAITCGPSSLKDDIGTCIRYSSFANNNATSQTCISFSNRGANTYKMHESNVISNLQPKNTIGTIGILTIQHSTILKNKGSPVFAGSIKLVKCSVSDDQYESASNINIYEVSVNSFINILSFISTGDCVKKFDHNKIITCENFIPIRRDSFIRLFKYNFLLSFLPIC